MSKSLGELLSASSPSNSSVLPSLSYRSAFRPSAVPISSLPRTAPSEKRPRPSQREEEGEEGSSSFGKETNGLNRRSDHLVGNSRPSLDTAPVTKAAKYSSSSVDIADFGGNARHRKEERRSSRADDKDDEDAEEDEGDDDDAEGGRDSESAAAAAPKKKRQKHAPIEMSTKYRPRHQHTKFGPAPRGTYTHVVYQSAVS
jgi:hypothetical protein